MVFEIDKIEYESLGKYLGKLRLARQVSIQDVSVACAVPAKYITALEESKYYSLPAEVYVVGFLRKLAAFYAMSPDLLVAQYKKEKSGSPPPRGVSAAAPVAQGWIPKIMVTPKIVSLFLGVCLIVVIVGWLIWQVISINTSPTLVINEPFAGASVKESFLKVQGKTDPGAELRINNQSVFVESDGSFTTVMSVSTGQRDLVFESENKFKKKTTKTISIKVDVPSSTSENAPKETEAGVVLDINVTRALPISLTIDGEVQPTIQVTPDSPKRVTAKDKIVLLTPDAGNTNVTVNGKNVGTLGRVGETLTVPFSKELLQE
jgi:cytoskeletal protein RodZ